MTSLPAVNGEIPGFEDAINQERLLYGWLSCRPDRLQEFNKIGWLVTALGGVCVVQGMILNGLVPAVSSTVATRYQLSSTQIGVIVAMYDLTVLVLVPFVSFALATKNKPRWLAAGAVVMSAGALVWSIPQFTSGLYVAGTNDFPLPLCEHGNTTTIEDVELSTESLSNYFYVFLLAQLLLGIGATPLYTVGYAWVDENTTTNKSGWYIGLMSAMSSMGIALGFVLGALCLGIYTDIGVETDLTPSDQAWVGAWWLGFLILSFAALLSAPPVGGFSPVLPETLTIQAQRKSQAHQNGSEKLAKQPNFGESWADIWPATKMTCSNPPFMFITLSYCCLCLYMAGATVFMVEFMENQFGVTASFASILIGGVSIPAAAFGSIFGGWITKKADLKVRGNLTFVILVCLGMTAVNCAFFLRCPQAPLAGVVRPYSPDAVDSQSDGIKLSNPCNAECHCTTFIYDPVCAANGLEYFDACYAGCEGMAADGSAYFNCSCVDATDTDAPDVRHGPCPTDDCWQLPVFVVALFFLLVIGCLAIAPMTIVTLRTVPDSQRSFGLGVQSTMYRLFGAAPSAIVFGAAIDSTCLVWQELPDKSTGSCWIYDGQALSLSFVLLGTLFLLVAAVLLGIAFVTYRAPKDEDDDESALLESPEGVEKLLEKPKVYGSVTADKD
ncbi:solute carrier organic anion transporter family member 4C1-like [Ptychodera flava]|uniref:solute carrier organic anion transporter family member 4C1-like n=1 Tax=Ptychodera flava TaxID=63121 RepID=UPI003969C4DF